MLRVRNYVAAFTKAFYKRNDMAMLELTPDFIKEFAAYLTTKHNLKNATIWLNCMWLKGVVMHAHYNGLIPRNPFAQFHISPNVKEREYLTEDEIKSFHLSTLKLSYTQAVKEYERRADTKIGRLIADRELPILRRAKEIIDSLA